MKFLLSIICLATCATLAVCTFCRSEDDCKEGRCCVAVSALTMSGKGLCIKLNRKKAKCNAPEAKMDYYGGKFLLYCPCESGLECDTGGAKGFGRCKVSEATTTSEVVTDQVTEEATLPTEVTEEETSAPEVVTDPEVDEETEAPVEEPEETEAPVEEPEETEAPVEEPEEPEVVEEPKEPEVVEEPEEPEDNGEEPEEIGQGPGGEPPRDDDCADWELPC